MRLREWHFPRVGNILTQNVTFAEVVKKMGFGTDANDIDIAVVGVPEEVAKEVQAAAENSMRTELIEEDFRNVNTLA